MLTSRPEKKPSPKSPPTTQVLSSTQNSKTSTTTTLSNATNPPKEEQQPKASTEEPPLVEVSQSSTTHISATEPSKPITKAPRTLKLYATLPTTPPKSSFEFEKTWLSIDPADR